MLVPRVQCERAPACSLALFFGVAMALGCCAQTGPAPTAAAPGSDCIPVASASDILRAMRDEQRQGSAMSNLCLDGPMES
jgi:hypothetical protein